jgi:hypothetical protein
MSLAECLTNLIQVKEIFHERIIWINGLDKPYRREFPGTTQGIAHTHRR